MDYPFLTPGCKYPLQHLCQALYCDGFCAPASGITFCPSDLLVGIVLPQAPDSGSHAGPFHFPCWKTWDLQTLPLCSYRISCDDLFLASLGTTCCLLLTWPCSKLLSCLLSPSALLILVIFFLSSLQHLSFWLSFLGGNPICSVN